MELAEVIGGRSLTGRILKAERQRRRRALVDCLWGAWWRHVPWTARWELRFDPHRDPNVTRDIAELKVRMWLATLDGLAGAPVGWLMAFERDRYGMWRVGVLTAGVPDHLRDLACVCWLRRHGNAGSFRVDKPAQDWLFSTKAGAAESDVVFWDAGGWYPPPVNASSR